MKSTTKGPPVDLYPNFLEPRETARLMDTSRQVGWSRGTIKLYGREISVPREEVLFGDDGLQYRYRGAILTGGTWPDFLAELRDRIVELSGFQFHFAVGNRYLDGKDSIGWHSDNFSQIGPRPPVASLTLGGTRRFKLRHNESRRTIDYDLRDGSLMIMRPGCQQEWEHCVPKTARTVAERINWTFRPHIDAVGR